ncbi:uncharacterized protein LOC104423788 [Eucalyptus grandis]|uniref:uncharacterized protein LOC104423788 n=1 Tax=Eucalyptus grandis TaxID=71139 RepID=UPI00192EC8AB|nr:uncharacterized protein LOC104423788 [Eucalyptus grandis]
MEDDKVTFNGRVGYRDDDGDVEQSGFMVSLPWLSSAVDVLTIAHSVVKSLIYELKRDGSDSLLSWYLDNSLKVLDVCNCMSSKIERLCLRHLDRKIAMKLLSSEGNPLEEEIHQARDLLADSEGEVDRVVCHAVQAVNFLTAFVVRVISSALRSSSGPVICLHIPEEFPWGDFVRAIESTIIVESRGGKERDRKMRVLKELDDVEAHGRHVLEVIDQVVASGGGREIVGRLREAAAGLEKATEALLEGLYQLRDEMKKLLLTVRRIRKEMADDFRASL